MRIGVDIGGTSIKAGLVEGKNVARSAQRETPKKKTEIIETIKDLIEDLKESPEDIESIGVGTPGPFRDTERLDKPGNLDLEGVSLKEELPYDIKLDNDANCFTLAEAMFGAGKDKRTVAGITLGTGIGGGLVTDKRVYRGRANAMEVFNIIIDKDKRTEDLIGRKAFEERFGMSQYEASVKAREKDKDALEAWKEFGKILAVLVNNVITTLDPEIVVIGGKVSEAWDFFSEAMMKKLEELSKFSPPPVKKKEVEHSGIVGAAHL
ncbi:MAG: ROK family protein [Nanobdellota archaeon]